MATVKDICRICLQEADYDEIQEIDVDKLKSLIEKSLLPKWDLSLFRDHIICDTCINNFRSLRNLYRLAWSSNWQIMRLRHRTSKKDAIDLKQLNKFKHARGDFFVCRLCLESTKHIAIYLFNSPSNIVPWVFINLMLKSAHLYMSLLDKTVNPVLCYQCWQRIQVSFSFRKHLNMVTEKFQYYQEMHLETFVNREDLQDMLQIWDMLGTENIAQSEEVIQHEEISPMRLTNIPCLKQEHNGMLFEEHNYCRNSIDSESTETCSSIDMGVDEMPCLMPSVADEDSKEVKALNLSVRSLQNLQQLNYGELDRRLNLTKLSKKKGASPKKPIIVNGHDGKMEKLVGILKSKAQKNKQRVDSNVEINRTFRRMTRLSARKEDLGETNSQDLLVLKKEEIIKKKPFKNSKATLPLPKSKKSSPKKCSNKFESLNFDKEAPPVIQAAIEDGEVQMKREVVSDSDDDFTENVANTDDNSIDEVAEQCPNLDVFIKSEPEEVVNVNAAEDEPPKLELQDPCNYDPMFVISNTFSVNDKRQVLNTVEEKRGLLAASSSNKSSSRHSMTLRQHANGSEATHSNRHNQYLNKYYLEIDELIINKAMPYKCRMCDFVTTYQRGAKLHVSLHTTNSILLYDCRDCSYQTTKKVNLREHYHRKHKGRKLTLMSRAKMKMPCIYCEMPGSTIKCLKCPTRYHRNCLLANHGIGTPGCDHLQVKGSMVISVDGHVVNIAGGDQKEWHQCDHCLKFIQNFINCKQCKRYFHYKCFFLSRVKEPDRCLHHVVPASCDQLLLIKSPPSDSTSSSIQANGTEETRKCDYCYGVVDSVIPCPHCLKFMHHACFVEDSTERKFNCRHTDIVGGAPVDCAYCGISAERTGVTCRLCNQTLHRVCLVRSKKKLNCEHSVVQPTTKKKRDLNNGDGFDKDGFRISGTQTSQLSEAIASTSRELKRETLDLSDFIMLCE